MTRTDDTEVPDYTGLLRLDGRGIVLIGAGQGIGRQAAHALAQAGAKVFCVDLDPDLAKDVAGEVDGIAWSGDAIDRHSSEQLFASAKDALGTIAGVVDIVGMSRYQAMLDIPDSEYDWHFGIVLRHAWLAVQHAGRLMSETGGGTMTFVASVSGLTAAPMHSVYGMAKAGLVSLIKSAAVELGPLGIRVNGVAPGVVWTPRVSGYLGEAGRKSNADNTPLRKVALPSDIAAALLFLTSDLAGYVNGQVLVVDGGVGVKFPYPMPDANLRPNA